MSEKWHLYQHRPLSFSSETTFVGLCLSAYGLLSLYSPPWHRLIGFYKSRWSTSCLCNELRRVNSWKISIKLHVMLWAWVYDGLPHFLNKNSMRRRCFISFWRKFLIPFLFLITKASWQPCLNSPLSALWAKHTIQAWTCLSNIFSFD